MIKYAIAETEPSDVVLCTVLLKLLMSNLIKRFGYEEGIEALATGINEAMDDLKQEGII